MKILDTLYLTDTKNRLFEIEYEFFKGSNNYFSTDYGNWLPGDSSEIVLKSAKVTLNKGCKNRTIDFNVDSIDDYFPISQIYDKIIEDWE